MRCMGGIFVKPNFQNKNFFSFFFFNSISTYIQCATWRLSLCDIRKYRFPAFYGTSDRQAAIFFWTRMIQTWSSFSLMDPCSILFCSSVKPKFFTPTHGDVNKVETEKKTDTVWKCCVGVIMTRHGNWPRIRGFPLEKKCPPPKIKRSARIRM